MTAEADQKGPKLGRVRKVVWMDEGGGKVAETTTKQLPEDDFRSMYGSDLQEPPFTPEQLVFLAEQHSVHSAALEQKAVDILGQGGEFRQLEGDNPTSDEVGKAALEEWWQSMQAPDRDETTHEILLSAVQDQEAVGWGTIEVARDPSGKVRYMYPMPSHTTRFARDGVRVCQIRAGKRVWFKRWMPDDDRSVGMWDGQIFDNKDAAGGRRLGNEVLVLRRPARRSSWYGIPTYVSALGWILLSTLARDDNILWFQNRREPRWAIILSNLEDDPNLDEELKNALRVDHKQPHRNIVIPIEGPGQIDFKQLSDLSKTDMSFEKLQERSNAYILVGHRIPSDRIGMTKLGPLGGSVTIDSTKVYKEGVVMPAQTALAARVNRFITHESEKPDVAKKWPWGPDELDLTEEDAEMTRAVSGFQGGILRLGESRVAAGYEPLEDNDERNNLFITELAMQAGGMQGGGTPADDIVNDNEPQPQDEQNPDDKQQQQEQQPPKK